MKAYRAWANGALDYTGQRASIETNGQNCLPWSIVLADGRKLFDCGSYETAKLQFDHAGLVAL